MPTPIGHSLAGFAIAQASRTVARSRRLLWWSIALASAPDIDFLFTLINAPERVRHRATHSLLAAAVAALVVALYARAKERRFTLHMAFLFVFALIGSHLLLDMMRQSLIPTDGVQLFWPFELSFYSMHPHIFLHTITSEPYAPLPLGVVLRHNTEMVAREIVVLGPIA